MKSDAKVGVFTSKHQENEFTKNSHFHAPSPNNLQIIHETFRTRSLPMDCKEGTLPLSFIHRRLPFYPNVSKLKVYVSFEEFVHIDGETHHHIDALGHGTVEVVVLGAVVQEIVKSCGYLEGCAETVYGREFPEGIGRILHGGGAFGDVVIIDVLTEADD